MMKTDIIWPGTTIRHARPGFDISWGDLKLNLKCFFPLLREAKVKPVICHYLV